jgi:DNA-binding LacI/PurR family transcriptional regulator
MPDNERKKPVLFISSALSPDGENEHEVLEYFVDILGFLSILLRKAGFDLMLKVPTSQSTAAKEQRKFLEFIYEKDMLKANYSGLIIVPFNLVEIESILSKLIYQNETFPILTIDRGYEKIRPEAGLKSAPPFVMCDQTLGGKIAANSLASYFIHNQKNVGRLPNVAVMAGPRDPKGEIDECSKKRIAGFRNRLKEAFPKAIICTEPSLIGDYNRSTAKRKAQKFLQQNEHDKIPNAFFCCNDEMALGVRDAIIEEKQKILKEYENVCKIPIGMSKRKEKKTHIYEQLVWINNIKVVGFDCIRELSTLLDDGDNWLLNSVNVVIHEQATEIVKIFIALKDKKQVPQHIEYPPVLGIELLKQNNKYNWSER